MFTDEVFENYVFPEVLADEARCRVFLKEVERRGARYSVKVEDLTHDECIALASRIYAEIKIQESK